MIEICSCHHMGIFTDSPQELIKFYTEKLGFREKETKQLSEELMGKIFGIYSPCSLTKLECALAVLEIIFPRSRGLKRRASDVSGYNHWGLGVKDKVEFCRRLREKGVEVINAESKGRQVFFIKDPEGNLIEIYEAS